MKIAVLSDTHALSFAELPSKLRQALAGVDLIVHAGDIVTREVLDGLRSINTVKAVRGNMDSPEIKSLLPETEVFTAGGKTVGVVHGSGGPQGIEERVGKLFTGVDVIIYGHSHVPQNRVIDGILFFNPGRCVNSFGLLTIEDEITGGIVTPQA